MFTHISRAMSSRSGRCGGANFGMEEAWTMVAKRHADKRAKSNGKKRKRQ
jgi:hypothetical protein